MQSPLPENQPVNVLDKRQLMATQLLRFFPTLHKLAPKIFRPLFFIMDRLLGMPYSKLYKVHDHVVPLTDGAREKIRIYYPIEDSTNTSTMVYFHGGGCVIGSIATHDRFCRYLAKQANINIVSVDYRLAPECKFPIPILDALSAWNWVMKHHAALGINPHKVGVGGDSAGGYLACLISLQKEQHALPIHAHHRPAFQFLLYPMLDLQGITPSYRESSDHLILTNHLMDYFKRHYLHDTDDVLQPLISPLQSQHLAQCPHTYLLTLEFDPLRDDGLAFATCLKDYGIPLNHQHFHDCMHGFISVTRISPRARKGCEEMAMALVQLSKQTQ